MSARIPPFSAWSSALIAAVVGFGGTVALVVHAMRMMGASVEETASGVTALCLGIAIAGAALSLRHRMPIVLAWSTPGAALLAATAPGMSWAAATGVFVAAALMMIALGALPVLGRLAERIPPAIASAMLAGVLLPFCLGLFSLASIDPLLVGLLLLIFIVARRRVPLHALLLALAAGILLTLIRGDVGALPEGAVFGKLVPVTPEIDAGAIISLAVPLFLVTLVSQNLPGLVVLRTAGYTPPPGPLLAGTGVASLTFRASGSGLALYGLGAAFCGRVVGFLALGAITLFNRR